MKNPPASPEHPTPFDLQATVDELRREEQYVKDGHAARTLIRAADLRVVVIALRAGETIAEHHVDVTASIQTLSGEVRVQSPDGTLAISVGQLLVIGPGRAHDVSAESDSAFLLTFGWPEKT